METCKYTYYYKAKDVVIFGRTAHVSEMEAILSKH